MVPPGLPVFLLLPVVTGFQLNGGGGRLCAFTSSLQGAEPALANELRGVVQENSTIRCSRGSRCYGLWEKRADGEMQLLNQGCWTHVGNQQECGGERCVLLGASPAQVWKANYRFCCCARDLCNTNFTEAPPPADTPALRLVKDDREDGRTGRQLMPEESALVALVTVAIAAILIVGLFLAYRMKRKHKHTLSTLDVLECGNSESSVDLDHLKLLELIGRGRYGSVFRGSLGKRCVAVKLFSSANRQNFANECSIYFLPLLRTHDNIAHFLSADERTASDGRPEFLIVMEFYPHGCLSQFLSSHTVDWLTCCRMTHGVTGGLAFLHTEVHRGEDYKPAVAHRDLSSRNVLVRADRSCVLADFGLSMRLTETRICRHGDDDTVAISEVGTVRYMSPEVLGGAVNLRDCEAALKQVDVYALGLMFWETFRRCSDLFPGETVPEYQLAFQAELGNHPSLEEMQTLVVREKFRPRFPEAWKENSLAIRSLKETMEDCWDQDAEARLTAQGAEERLCDLLLMATPTAGHNHRNLLHGRRPPASSFIGDFQVGVVRNLQGDAHPAALIRTGPSGADVLEKNRNYEQQQGPLFTSTLPPPLGSSRTSTLPPPPPLCAISECQHSGGAVPSVPACLQPTEEDLEATKMEAAEVEKNLRSHEDLTDLSKKHFTSEPQSSALLLLQANDSTGLSGAVSSTCGAVRSTHPLPKQQNLPQRPSSLHLLPRTNHRQVQTGVAKMNTVATVLAAEPHLVTNNTSWRGGASSGVTSSYTLVGGGRSNPAGPQAEQEKAGEVMEAGEAGGDDGGFNLLLFSPDEQEPLLRREQPLARSDPPPGPARSDPPPGPAQSDPPPGSAHGQGSNANNNNNRLNQPPGGAVTDLHCLLQPTGKSPGPGLCHQEAGPSTGPGTTGPPALDCRAEGADPQGPNGPTWSSGTSTGGPPSLLLIPSSSPDPEPPASDPEPSDPDYPEPEPPASESRTSELLLQILEEPIRVWRPERPRSLDLSSSCGSSEFESGGSGVLTASGEKIKRRVKTPYTLKKWRPASWVVPTDINLDPDLDFTQTQDSSGLVRPGTAGFPKINQSKSSMAVFLVGGGATATTTSEPDGMTSF